MSSKPIGIFDSGVGGLSIWKEINLLLPYESTLYLSDAKHAPYGPKGKEAILKRSITMTEKLLKMGSKIIVVACNTATTNAITHLRQQYNIPFIGIEPAIKPAALTSASNTIGILATKGTLSSVLFHQTSHRYSQNIKVIEQNGDGIVSLIESGALHSEKMKQLLKSYLNPMIKNKIDCLVLGCTHYHFLTPILKDLLPKNVQIIDSGEAVAKQTAKVIKKHRLINEELKGVSHKFYTNGAPQVMANLMGWKSTTIDKIPYN